MRNFGIKQIGFHQTGTVRGGLQPQLYSDFPKIFNKLFKGLEVRTVTDSKGNTWYEVDIPENFLESEWLFKKGGILGLNKIIGL